MAAGALNKPKITRNKHTKRDRDPKSVLMDNGITETEFEIGDVCESLIERYARSTAPQHRHLCASAAAMRSLLVEEGAPLTPAAYFSFAVGSICDSSIEDCETISAVSAFLSVLIPNIPPRSISPGKAIEAANSVVSVLENSDAMGAPVVRSLVGSLGILILSVDLEDWLAVELPLKMLLRFSVDKRPKVFFYL